MITMFIWLFAMWLCGYSEAVALVFQFVSPIGFASAMGRVSCGYCQYEVDATVFQVVASVLGIVTVVILVGCEMIIGQSKGVAMMIPDAWEGVLHRILLWYTVFF